MVSDRSRGKRLTRQRKLVLDIIQSSQEHLDAEGIYQYAQMRDKKISLATVYRALAYLKETGLVQDHSLGQDHAHFEPAQAEPHYHFTCKKCGQIIEFEAPQVIEVIRSLYDSRHLLVTEVHLLLSGYCNLCHPSTKSSPSE